MSLVTTSLATSILTAAYGIALVALSVPILEVLLKAALGCGPLAALVISGEKSAEISVVIFEVPSPTLEKFPVCCT